LLAPLPLLNVLQVEAAAVVAFVAFFVAGGAAIRAFGKEESLGCVLWRQEAALLVPLAVLTITQLWAPNCTFAQGLLFYVLFPGVTVVFAVTVAYALQGLSLSRPGLALMGIGGAIVVGGPLYDLGLHPQFYTYNHVFGGVLGPIYDEQLAVRDGLFVFRGLTLLWAAAAALFGLRVRGRGPRWALPLCALVVGLVYAFSGPLGLNTPAWYLQEQLGGHTQTPHFDLYYDSGDMGEQAVADLARAHEARYEWGRRRLALGSNEQTRRIQSYIYPSPDAKGRLTGARTTSVTPVWLGTPQVHLLRRRVGTSLGHELAHVLSRPYGLPALNASWAPGLIEGWAVALEPPSSRPSPDDLVLTALTVDSTTSLQGEAQAVANRLSPWGFWTGRGAVSYATMGSFVKYLLDRYGPEKLKRVYAWGSFERVYNQSLRTLAQEWGRHLRGSTAVERDAHGVVARQFTRPSLFEMRCPHHVPPPRQHLQAARRAARQRDTSAMTTHLDRALARKPRFAAAHEERARVRLARGQIRAVQQQLDTLSASVRTIGLQLALADARALAGATASARALYGAAYADTPTYAHNLRARLMLRDAVADRPSIVQLLVSGDSAAVHAQRLADLKTSDGAVRAWRGVRAMDARQYRAALSAWRSVKSPVRGDRPRGWHREWRLQRRAWGSKAALRAGSTNVARRWAERAASQAEALGDRGRTTLFEWRAARARAKTFHPARLRFGWERSTLGRFRHKCSVASDHEPRLLVGRRRSGS